METTAKHQKAKKLQKLLKIKKAVQWLKNPAPKWNPGNLLFNFEPHPYVSKKKLGRSRGPRPCLRKVPSCRSGYLHGCKSSSMAAQLKRTGSQVIIMCPPCPPPPHIPPLPEKEKKGSSPCWLSSCYLPTPEGGHLLGCVFRTWSLKNALKNGSWRQNFWGIAF